VLAQARTVSATALCLPYSRADALHTTRHNKVHELHPHVQHNKAHELHAHVQRLGKLILRECQHARCFNVDLLPFQNVDQAQLLLERRQQLCLVSLQAANLTAHRRESGSASGAAPIPINQRANAPRPLVELVCYAMTPSPAHEIHSAQTTTEHSAAQPDNTLSMSPRPHSLARIAKSPPKAHTSCWLERAVRNRSCNRST